MEETRTWTEAPCSITIKVNFHGYDTLLTLRGDTGADVLPKLTGAIDWLKVNGGQPTPGRNGNGHGDPSAPQCPTHGQAMKPSKHGGFYCPVKIADDDGAGRPVYCKQKA